MRGKGFFRVRVKLAGARVPFNDSVELLRVEGLEPRAKSRQLPWSQLFDGLFDVFGSGHVGDIAFASDNAKAATVARDARRMRDRCYAPMSAQRHWWPHHRPAIRLDRGLRLRHGL